MRSIEEIMEIRANNPIVGITVKATGETYMRGENPYYDMQIDNYAVWLPENGDNWYGFIRDNYKPIYRNRHAV